MRHLQELVEVICKDLSLSRERFFSQYTRGKASKARHIFALAATDAGLPHLAVSSFLQRDPSYVTQVRRRKHSVRQSVEYHHAYGFLKARMAHPISYVRQRRIRYANA